MTKTAEKFVEVSSQKSLDIPQREAINFKTSVYKNAVQQSLLRLDNLDYAKNKAHSIKWKAVENLDKLLPEFESNFQKKGGKVIWANSATEANQEVLNILKKVDAKKVIKSQSAITDEINLAVYLQANSIDFSETDFNSYITQLFTQKQVSGPTSATLLNKENIAKLFNEHFETAANASVTQIAEKVRSQLRGKYITADVSITGANFMIADTGSISISENEGNTRLITSFTKTHIAIVGIEKLVPSISDLDLLWPLLSTHATGQNLTVYNTIIGGPKQLNETDGPEEMYVILVDNGRTELLAKKDQRQALYCIKCGACSNVCPVYKNIGADAYDATYTGPIGSVINPHLKGMQEFKHLSYASTLCGKCTEVCPVKIDIHQMLLMNRKDAVATNLQPATERVSWFFWKKAILNHWFMDAFGGKLKSSLLKLLLNKKWGANKDLPKSAESSFSAQWKKKQKDTNNQGKR